MGPPRRPPVAAVSDEVDHDVALPGLAPLCGQLKHAHHRLLPSSKTDPTGGGRQVREQAGAEGGREGAARRHLALRRAAAGQLLLGAESQHAHGSAHFGTEQRASSSSGQVLEAWLLSRPSEVSAVPSTSGLQPGTPHALRAGPHRVVSVDVEHRACQRLGHICRQQAWGGHVSTTASDCGRARTTYALHRASATGPPWCAGARRFAAERCCKLAQQTQHGRQPTRGRARAAVPPVQ